MLYKFEKLDKILDEWGFPKRNAANGFQIVKMDFEKAYKAGSISFEEDGIYLEYEGVKLRGYMFIKEPYLTGYMNYPKFHLTKCATINEFIRSNKFKQRYEWANSNKNDLIDFETRKVYKDVVLEYCRNCRKKLLAEIEDTEDFFDTLDKEDVEASTLEVNIFGYHKNWERISRKYRQKVDYICENCGVTPIEGASRHYWHVDHKNGDKTNNKLSNLQCLCILCHSYKDANHIKNFSGRHSIKEKLNFVSLYRNKLIELKNPYLKVFENELKNLKV